VGIIQGGTIIAGSGLSEAILFPGAPTNGTSGTYAGVAPKGALLNDTVNGLLYQNTNTQASPTWTKVGTET
jgi:hypothetical protein